MPACLVGATPRGQRFGCQTLRSGTTGMRRVRWERFRAVWKTRGRRFKKPDRIVQEIIGPNFRFRMNRASRKA